MPTLKGAKTRKYSQNRNNEHKTRNHSNLRPKHQLNKNFLKVYYPYIPLLLIVLLTLCLIQPWYNTNQNSQKVLPYATSMSVDGLVRKTNDRRLIKKTNRLQLNTKLSQAAQIKAQDMANRNYWSHNTPEGNAPWEFINNVGYSYKKAGENLAYGFANESDVIDGWMNSYGHRENMLDPTYKEVGFGFAQTKNYQKSGPSTVVVAMYGTPSSDGNISDIHTLPDHNLSYNTLGVSEEPNDIRISKVQTILTLPLWVNYLIVGFIGGSVVYIALKHGRRLKRSITHGEKYILKHPVVDITLVAFIALCIVLSQRSGIIR